MSTTVTPIHAIHYGVQEDGKRTFEFPVNPNGEFFSHEPIYSTIERTPTVCGSVHSFRTHDPLFINPDKAPLVKALIREGRWIVRLDPMWSGAIAFTIARQEEYFGVSTSPFNSRPLYSKRRPLQRIRNRVANETPAKDLEATIRTICSRAEIPNALFEILYDGSILESAQPLLNRVGSAVYVRDGLVKARDLGLRQRAAIIKVAEWSVENGIGITPEEGVRNTRHLEGHCVADVHLDPRTTAQCWKPASSCAADRNAHCKLREEMGIKEQIWAEDREFGPRDLTAREKALTYELGIAKEQIKRLTVKHAPGGGPTNILGLMLPLTNVFCEDTEWREFIEELEQDYDGGDEDAPDSIS